MRHYRRSSWNYYWERVWDTIREYWLRILVFGIFFAIGGTLSVKIAAWTLDLTLQLEGWKVAVILYILWLIGWLIFALWDEYY